MAVEIILPRVDMDMQAGRIARWLVQEGEAVTPGAPLFEIETSKAAMEIEATAGGILHIVAGPEGGEIAVGSVVAYLLAPDEAVPEAAPAASAAPISAPAPVDPASPVSTPISAPVAADDAALLRATPLARRLARSEGMNLAAIAGSGPRGRITRLDVARHARDAALPAATARTGGLPVRRAGGREGTPVVFLHGFASEALAWNGLIAALAQRAGGACPPLLAFDLPGHGAAPHSGEASFAALAEAAIGALRTEGIGTAHLVGHSLGGALAARIALDGRIDAASLVLLAPAGLGAEIDAATLDGILRARAPDSLLPWMERLFAAPARADAALLRATLEGGAAPGRGDFRQRLALACFPDGTQSARLRWQGGAIAAPARIVWGRQDRIIPWRHALAAPGRFALHLLDDCGHMPQIEATGAVADILAETLRGAQVLLPSQTDRAEVAC
ncbi:acetoin dehydrogenase dihydrolipoyllysine-residue acetyltransferase subunit [Acidiphilium multivorum]|uniref:acetoin dehydrogenase dihydrolipoyllysine-residue acetyltransferase subunit n=1 Tax=Acidiphilium multivorum TaxID=62140 RepID=UPI0039C8DB09